MSYVSPIKIGYEAEPEEGWTDKIGKYIAGEVDNLVLESCVKVGCHVDKDELEKALRYDRDQYVKGYEDGKRDAAAAIEALQAEFDQWKAAVKGQEDGIKVLQAEVKRLQGKLCDWCAVCPKERRNPDDCELLGENQVMYGPSVAKMEVQE